MAAASDQPEGSYSAGRIEQLLRCPICLDRFKRPKLLPCQHTFCKSPCLEGLWGGYRRTIRCPECRMEHRVPIGGVDGFPNNITLSGFLDLPVLDTVAREPPRATPAPATTKCAVCGNDTDTRQCVHCDKLVCPPCLHSHMAQMKLGIGHLLRQLRDGLPQLTRSLDGATEWGEQTARRVSAARAAMTTAIDAKVRALRERQTMLNSELDSFVQQERRALQARREAVELDVASVSSFCDSAERTLQALDASDQADLVDMQTQCTEQLEKIRRAGTTSPHIARRVIYVQQNADQLQESIERFGQFQFNTGESSPAHARSGPDVTISDVPNPDIFFDLPDYGDITGSGTGRHDPPFQSPRLDLLSSASGTSLFPPIRQEAPPVPRSEETRVAATGSPEVFFPPLAVEPTQARDPQAHVPRRVRDYMYEMDTSTDDVRDIVDAMRREVLGPRRQGGGTLFTYDVRQVDPGFMPGAGDSLFEPAGNTEPGQNNSQSQPQVGERVDMEVDTAAAATTSQSDLPATMSRGRTFVQPSGARSAAVELPVVNNQSTSFNISADSGDGVRRRRRYDRDTAAVLRVLSIYQAKGRSDPVCTIQGSASCRLKWPRGVAVSPINDFIIIADSNNDRVQVFDSNGRFVSTFGSGGAGDGEFDRPSGTAVTSSGHIVVCDSNNHRVQVFDRHGHFSHKFGSEGTDDGQLSSPCGVAVDTSGLIYVCDRDNDRVQVFQADGAFVRVIGRGSGSERGRLLRPQYVAVARNNVVVSDSGNHRVQTFNAATGEALSSFGIEGSAAGMLRNPKGVGIDRDGFIVVADSGNNRVQVYREDGQFVSAFGGWGSGPGNFRGLEGVAVTTSHKVFVGDRENHRVQKF